MTKLKAIESALEDALRYVRQLDASDLEPKPEPEPVRGPLTVAPVTGSVYWWVNGAGVVRCSLWRGRPFDERLLARGNAFASKEDADYKSAFDEIWGQPIGEWEPDSKYWIADITHTAFHSSFIASAYSGIRRQWRKGEVGFGDAGKAELERRLAEQKKLDERFGL